MNISGDEHYKRRESAPTGAFYFLFAAAVKRRARIRVGRAGRKERIRRELDLAECLARVARVGGALLSRNTEIVGRNHQLHVSGQLDNREGSESDKHLLIFGR